MSKFVYIETQAGDKYFLDAVFSVSYKQGSKITKYAVESGEESSDHYTNTQDGVNVSGSVSAVKFVVQGGQSTSLQDFERKLTALKKSGQFFSVFFSDNMNPLRNCLFSSLSMTKDTATGRHSILVDMSITQIVVADRAEEVIAPKALAEFQDIVETRKGGSGNTVEVEERDSQTVKKLFEDLAEGTSLEALGVTL